MSEQKMNPEIKARWVAALRSGEYKQGKSLLRPTPEEFCCLGVLCDLHARESGDVWADGGYLRSWRTLPNAVCQWSGLGENFNPHIRIGTVADWLANHNDNGRTFAEIADAIEAQL